LRNIFCKKYSNCLDDCIKKQSLDFDCNDCHDFENEKLGISIQEFFGACVLLSKLFMPEAYQEYFNAKND